MTHSTPIQLDISRLDNDQCLSFPLHEQACFVVKKSGQYHAYLNQCPHTGAPLEFVENQFLTLDKSLIQCALHGALFDIKTGTCISGPCLGKGLTPLQIKQEEQILTIQSC